MSRNTKYTLIVVASLSLLVAGLNFLKKERTVFQDSSEEIVPVKEMDVYDAYIQNLSLEEKVGQLFFVRVPETNQVEDISNYHLGGYVLFGRDIEGQTAESFEKMLADYQQAADIPLLIGSDEEGGTVTRISRNVNLVPEPFLSPQELYQQGGFEAIKEDTQNKAKIFHKYGIQTGLYPIADVATDQNAFIYDRTIGLDTQGTSDYVEHVVKELKANKIGSTLKHFPGYGNNRDSHIEIVHDTRTIDELREHDFPPFIAGTKAGADSILVAHNIVEAIDATVPASISPKVHQLIREEIGFDGVVMTDDMDMAGLADFINQEEAGLKALQAGNDLVMSSSYQRQIPYVIAAVKNGELSEKQIDESVKRVLQWKENLGLMNIKKD